jgi:hypothetical protein
VAGKTGYHGLSAALTERPCGFTRFLKFFEFFSGFLLFFLYYAIIIEIVKHSEVKMLYVTGGPFPGFLGAERAVKNPPPPPMRFYAP